MAQDLSRVAIPCFITYLSSLSLLLVYTDMILRPFIHNYLLLHVLHVVRAVDMD